MFLIVIVLSVIIITVFDDGQEIEYFNEDRPIPPVPNKLKTTIRLYFADKNKLIGEDRTIVTNDMKFEKAIVEELIKGPRNKLLKSTIPKETKLISIETIDNVCYVNFSRHFIETDTWEKVEEPLIIWSLVNSLTELHYIQKVQILIEGEKIDLAKKSALLKPPFVRNEGLIMDEKMTPFNVITKFLDNILKERYDKAYTMLDNESAKNIGFDEFSELMANYVKELQRYEIKLYNTQLYGEYTIVTITYRLSDRNSLEYKKEFSQDWKVIVEDGEYKIVLKVKDIKI
jgi:hypothetical protein